MYEILSTWMIDCTDLHIRQSQAPVSINSCLTIEGLLKKCISEEVPRGFFLRTVIVNRRNSCELKPKKNLLVLRQWADLFQFSKFRNVQTQNNILNFFTFVSQRRLLKLLSYGDVIISIFPLLVFLKQLLYLSLFFVINFLFLISKKTSTYIIFQRLKEVD